MQSYEIQNAKYYVFPKDPFTDFFSKFVTVGQNMHRAGKCEKIVVVCARPTQHKTDYLTWRLLACGGNVKDILEGYVRACKNIAVSPKGMYILKPVHDALKVRVRLLDRKNIDPKPGVRGFMITKEEKKCSGNAVEGSTFPKSTTSFQMLTNQLKDATRTALKVLGSSNIQILATKKSAQPPAVYMPLSEPTVDEIADSQIMMISPPPSPTAVSAVNCIHTDVPPPSVAKRHRSKGVSFIMILFINEHVILLKKKILT